MVGVEVVQAREVLAEVVLGLSERSEVGDIMVRPPTMQPWPTTEDGMPSIGI